MVFWGLREVGLLLQTHPTPASALSVKYWLGLGPVRETRILPAMERCLTLFPLLHSEGVFKCPEDQLPLDYAKVRPMPTETRVYADVLGGGWSCQQPVAQCQCQPSAVEPSAPTKVACSLPSRHFANEAPVCPRGQAQCPACGGAQSCSVLLRSAPLLFGSPARPVAEGQVPSSGGS